MNFTPDELKVLHGLYYPSYADARDKGYEPESFQIIGYTPELVEVLEGFYQEQVREQT